MRFTYPEQTWWWLAIAAFIALAVVALSRTYRSLRAFRTPNNGLSIPVTISPLRLWLKVGLRCAAVVLLGIAVMGPCWGEQELPPLPVRGRDLFVLLDVSRSMLAEDVQPNRLERAKQGLGQLAAHLERKGGYRIGLIAFADRAGLLCPLTTDFQHFYQELKDASLEGLRSRREGATWVNGTQLGLALARAERALPKPPEGAEDAGGFCDLLVVSDGGDDLDAETLAVADALAKKHVRVYTMGIGDPVKASPIPVKLANGQRQYLVYEGQQVTTRLEEATLQQVAKRSGGEYLAAGVAPVPLDRLLGLVESQGTRELQSVGQVKDPIQRFEWFLLPAVLILCLENLVRTRIRYTARETTEAVGRLHWLVKLVPPPRRKTPPATAASPVPALQGTRP